MKRFASAALLPLLVAACATPVPVEEPAPRPVVQVLAPTPRPEPGSASLWNQDPESLFGNRRAREVGDLLTVIVEINDEAQFLNDTRRERINERLFDAQAALGLPQWAERALPGDAGLNPGVDLESQQRFRGLGNVRRSDILTLRLAARVTGELANGDLVIEGQQNVQVGADHRRLVVSGVVRPEDISRQNTILHERIADADIRYLPRGPLQRTGAEGAGNRFLDIILPF
ncbi:MAG: flagellar basal body L-ring protein FlgH [Parvularcula sp.]|jgi:flagellar L-ring protein precursor FlgH|nr:flagellar basal body L-ring protein FlgH [Parvularcula sp.]